MENRRDMSKKGMKLIGNKTGNKIRNRIRTKIEKIALAGALGVLGALYFGTDTAFAMEEKVPSGNDSELVYCIGSVSKVYSTTAVMQLVEEGKVDLDAPVTDYIPDFRMADERYRQITVRMLMNHTAGFMGTTWNGIFLYGDIKMEHHDTLLKELAGQRLKADPGKYAAYCNDGFDLLEILVERVTGMTYIDYVTSKIAAPTGGKNTGNAMNMWNRPDMVKGYTADNLLYDTGCIMCQGAGGIYATASDVAKFGASFFTGNETILSQKAKEKMQTPWNASQPNPYMDGCGLGWDTVSEEAYEKQGITVLGKGGDVIMNHAYLCVAPDEKISVSVLSNGGSSACDEFLAKAIMDVILEEEGLLAEVNADEKNENLEPVWEIPSAYDAYEGYYVSNGETGSEINKISFPDHLYMHVETIGATRRSSTDYVLTSEGNFASLVEEMEELNPEKVKENRIDLNPMILGFETSKEGKTYITCNRKTFLAGLGRSEHNTYVGERLEASKVSDTILEQWNDLSGSEFLLVNEPASSQFYDSAIVRMYLPKEVPGYVFCCTGMGTRLLKIVDETNAVTFTTIPSSINRDMIDATIEKTATGYSMDLSNGLKFISSDQAKVLDTKVGEVELEDGAKWFVIDDTIANDTIHMDRPGNATVNVYSKYGDVVYTSHVMDASEDVPMPKGGKVVFIGEKGDKVTLQ